MLLPWSRRATTDASHWPWRPQIRIQWWRWRWQTSPIVWLAVINKSSRSELPFWNNRSLNLTNPSHPVTFVSRPSFPLNLVTIIINIIITHLLINIIITIIRYETRKRYKTIALLNQRSTQVCVTLRIVQWSQVVLFWTKKKTKKKKKTQRRKKKTIREWKKSQGCLEIRGSVVTALTKL